MLFLRKDGGGVARVYCRTHLLFGCRYSLASGYWEVLKCPSRLAPFLPASPKAAMKRTTGSSFTKSGSA